ncbi:hypothetical protein OIU77_021270 [Salix suchowensis]|uniref:Uncharacterized protein n=1 Tax=Salix suchowensis TaxID=1278906 RepID=A0ABQ9CD54_9ROSI|nr:hypothetical protein OIU77_021270 [Salix suchowensis]
MDDSGAILCQISSLKDMLDQVNEEIEANIRITREIESEIVKCTEFEAALAARESDLTKTFYFSQFEINGLLSVAYESKKSVKLLEEEVCGLRKKKMEMPESMDDKRYSLKSLFIYVWIQSFFFFFGKPSGLQCTH